MSNCLHYPLNLSLSYTRTQPITPNFFIQCRSKNPNHHQQQSLIINNKQTEQEIQFHSEQMSSKIPNHKASLKQAEIQRGNQDPGQTQQTRSNFESIPNNKGGSQVHSFASTALKFPFLKNEHSI